MELALRGFNTTEDIETMRFRIENQEGKAWDTVTSRWQSIFYGYSSYKTEGLAVSAGRQIKSSRFLNAETKRIVEDIEP